MRIAGLSKLPTEGAPSCVQRRCPSLKRTGTCAADSVSCYAAGAGKDGVPSMIAP
jgi:hypothetical protein